MADNCILSINATQRDFYNSQNDKGYYLSTSFNNVGLTGYILSKENLFNYLSENGFTTYKTHLNKHLEYYEKKVKTPITLTVSMSIKGEYSEFESALNPLMSKIAKGEKLGDETQGEIKPFLLEGWKTVEQSPIEKEALEIRKMDLSDCGMARFLDSNYSIDTLINWLESKQIDIPFDVFKLAKEVKSWMPELKPQAETVPDAGADNDSEFSYTTWLRETWMKEGETTGKPFFNALKNYKGKENSIVLDWWNKSINGQGVKLKTVTGDITLPIEQIQKIVSRFRGEKKQKKKPVKC